MPKTKIKKKVAKKLNSENPKLRIKEKSYTKEDMVFIAQKFIIIGLNLQSIVGVMKEQNILESLSDEREKYSELLKTKEKMINIEDVLKKLDTVEKVQTAITSLDVFQMSILEKLK